MCARAMNKTSETSDQPHFEIGFLPEKIVKETILIERHAFAYLHYPSRVAKDLMPDILCLLHLHIEEGTDVRKEVIHG